MKKIAMFILFIFTSLLLGCKETDFDTLTEEGTKQEEIAIHEENQEILEIGQIIKGMRLVSIKPIQNKPLDHWNNAAFTFEGSVLVKGVFEKQTFDTCDNLLFVVTDDFHKLPLSERKEGGAAICINNLNREVNEGEEAILELKNYTWPAANFGPISPYAEIK